MEPLDIVLSFIEGMNEWEHKMYLVSRVKSGQVINHKSDQAILPSEPYEEFMQKYYEVFNAHCTKRDRKYGGFPSSWCQHGQYQGASKESVASVKNVNSNRTEIILDGGNFLGNKFLFVVLKKSEKWQIDSAKSSQGEQWLTHLL